MRSTQGKTKRSGSALGGSMASPPRRITRASLARFAYGAVSPSSNGTSPVAAPPPPIADIEDGPTPRKRARTTSAWRKRPAAEATGAPALQETGAAPNAAPRRARRQPGRSTAQARPGGDASRTVTAPAGWEATYRVAREMRERGAAANAAVDSMGCERLADASASARDQRFQTLVALMLSSQTRDATNAAAMRRLHAELAGPRPGLNLASVLAVEPDRLRELIGAVGFHNNKTRYLKRTAVLLRDVWGGDVPDTIAGLTSLPGVGPKMAYLCLSAAWGRTEGIGVDVHVHRITNLWGWHETKKPEETRMALQSWLPRDKWREINWLLVGLGQTVCAPVGRRCGDCELGLRGLCKGADKVKVSQAQKLRQAKVEVEHHGQVKWEELDRTETAVGETVKDEVKCAPSVG